MSFGREYLIPTPFDPRLIYIVSTAVARTAIETGVARKTITDWKRYEAELKLRIGGNPAADAVKGAIPQQSGDIKIQVAQLTQQAKTEAKLSGKPKL